MDLKLKTTDRNLDVGDFVKEHLSDLTGYDKVLFENLEVDGKSIIPSGEIGRAEVLVYYTPLREVEWPHVYECSDSPRRERFYVEVTDSKHGLIFHNFNIRYGKIGDKRSLSYELSQIKKQI